MYTYKSGFYSTGNASMAADLIVKGTRLNKKLCQNWRHQKAYHAPGNDVALCEILLTISNKVHI